MMEGEVTRDDRGVAKSVFLKPNSGSALGMGGLAYYSVLMGCMERPRMLPVSLPKLKLSVDGIVGRSVRTKLFQGARRLGGVPKESALRQE